MPVWGTVRPKRTKYSRRCHPGAMAPLRGTDRSVQTLWLEPVLCGRQATRMQHRPAAIRPAPRRFAQQLRELRLPQLTPPLVCSVLIANKHRVREPIPRTRMHSLKIVPS